MLFTFQKKVILYTLFLSVFNCEHGSHSWREATTSAKEDQFCKTKLFSFSFGFLGPYLAYFLEQIKGGKCTNKVIYMTLYK